MYLQRAHLKLTWAAKHILM